MSTNSATDDEIEAVKQEITGEKEKREKLEAKIEKLKVKIENEKDAEEKKALREKETQLNDEETQLYEREGLLNERFNFLLRQWKPPDAHPGHFPLPPAKKLTTKPRQKGASGFTASIGKHCGWSRGDTIRTRMGATACRKYILGRHHLLFVHILEANRISGPMTLVSEADDSSMHGYTDQAMFLDGIAGSAPFARKMTTERPRFRDGLGSSTNRNLDALGLTDGISTEASFMD